MIMGSIVSPSNELSSQPTSGAFYQMKKMNFQIKNIMSEGHLNDLSLKQNCLDLHQKKARPLLPNIKSFNPIVEEAA